MDQNLILPPLSPLPFLLFTLIKPDSIQCLKGRVLPSQLLCVESEQQHLTTTQTMPSPRHHPLIVSHLYRANLSLGQPSTSHNHPTSNRSGTPTAQINKRGLSPWVGKFVC